MNFVKAKLRKDLSLYNFGGACDFFLESWLSDATPLLSTSKGGASYLQNEQDFLQAIESSYFYKKVEKLISVCFFLPNELSYKSLDINLYHIIQAFYFDHHTVLFDKLDWELN